MKKNIYTIIRRIHLYMAFVLLIFVSMYFITGFILSHEDWFTVPDPEVKNSVQPINLTHDISIATLIPDLQNQLKIKAKRGKPTVQQDGSFTVTFFRPGQLFTISVSANYKLATIRHEKLSGFQVIKGFHRMHGYTGSWLYNLYILMMDLASLATILFGFTGIYLWYKLIKNKAAGFLILAGSIGYTAIIIYLFL